MRRQFDHPQRIVEPVTANGAPQQHLQFGDAQRFSFGCGWRCWPRSLVAVQLTTSV
jgi:hypothetical protein